MTEAHRDRSAVRNPLLLALTGFVGFLVLAFLVSQGIFLQELDNSLAEICFRFARQHETVWHVAVKLSQCGDGRTQVVVLTVVASFFLFRLRYLIAITFALAQLLTHEATKRLKLVFARPRPIWNDAILQLSDFSFPSGHSSGAMALYGLLAYLIVRDGYSRVRLLAAGLCMLLVLSIGFSRMLLGVHYLSDVLAGFCLGMITIGLTETVNRRFDWTSRQAKTPD